MGNISRRDLLRYSAALGTGAVLPFSATPAAAKIPAVAVAIGLAVASFVGGLIASNNRRNIELYMMQAVLEELQIIHEQLASIQLALAVILRKLADLDIANIVAKQSVRDLHAKLLGVIQEFNARELVGFPSKDLVDQADRLRIWLHADGGRVDRLQAYQAKIAALTHEQNFGDSPSDPTAAMVLEFACDAEFRLMILRNMDEGAQQYGRDYMSGACEEYRKAFLRVKDSKIPGSAAWFKANSETARDQIVASINANPLGSLLKDGAPAFNCAEFRFQSPYYLRNANFVDEHRIYQSISVAKYDALSDSTAKELLTEIRAPQDASDAPPLLFTKLVFEGPPKYQRRRRGRGPLGANFPMYSGSWGTYPEVVWDGGGSDESCITGERPSVAWGFPQSLQSTTKWDRLRYHYAPSDEEISKLYAAKAPIGPDIPLKVLIEDLNAEEAKIAYAKVGLEAADRALENIDSFLAYLKHI